MSTDHHERAFVFQRLSVERFTALAISEPFSHTGTRCSRSGIVLVSKFVFNREICTIDDDDDYDENNNNNINNNNRAPIVATSDSDLDIYTPLLYRLRS